MIHIAIVEDNPAYAEQLNRYVREHGMANGVLFRVDNYADGIEIAESYAANLDIIFMDIEMRHMNRMEAARRIRRYDKNVIIIFITNLAQYFIQGYEVEAMDYVLKPINRFAFEQELQKALKKIRERAAFYQHILKDGNMVRLDVANIHYIESQGHNIVVHTAEGTYSNRDSLKNIETRLQGHHFSRCNSGLLVNLAWVERVEKNTVSERLDRGLLDFAVIVQEADLSQYNALPLPAADRWGLILRRDHPLAEHSCIHLHNLMEVPLILSRLAMREEMPRWFGEAQDKLNIVATYDLLFNASVMVREGFGCALGFEGLVYTGPDSDLCFRSLEPALTSPMYIIWRKYQVFSPAAALLLAALKQAFGTTQSDG